MSKNLVIVESPAKTRTLQKFLGKDYQIEASLGHVRDLPKKDMGLADGYEPKYEVLAAKKAVVAKLRKAAKKADFVFLAPDPDREGEAIAWHIAQIIDSDVEPDRIRRVTFNEITKQAVLRALANPGPIDDRKVEAQQARRILDRLMGFKLSPLLWEKVKQGLSAGRVQSVALKMVCDREDEIEAFVPEEYWVLTAHLEGPEPPAFTARLHKVDGKKAKVGDGETAAEIAADAEAAASWAVSSIERKERKQRPQPPFITSRLQQEASRRFGFSVKRTMGIAQGLYEGKEIGSRGSIGLITYMRTDSIRTAEEALTAVREHIASRYGADQMPKGPVRYRSKKKGAQDAHEAIRPTFLDLPPESVERYLKPDDSKLYRLIWDRFVASQMNPAIFDVTRVDVTAGRSIFRASGKVLREPGFLAVYREVTGEEEQEADLPPLEEGQDLRLEKLDREQKFTQPPPRFSEATLVRALEENGIGRPSTYASILSTLTDRDYADKRERRFHPLPLGRLVNKLLQQGFNDIINESYTAELEEQLDKIEEGELAWKDALVAFDAKFERDLHLAEKEMPNVKREGVPIGEDCPECGAPLAMRFGRFGTFVGCSAYPECRYTRNLEEPAAAEDPGEEPEEIPPCEKCGSPMALRRSRYGTFYGCSAYPECKNIRKTEKERQASEPKPTGIACPQCGKGEIAEKRSRRGKIFYSCDRYPECDYALWNRPIAEQCPDCGAPFLVEKTTKKKGHRFLCNDKECGYERPA